MKPITVTFVDLDGKSTTRTIVPGDEIRYQTEDGTTFLEVVVAGKNHVEITQRLPSARLDRSTLRWANRKYMGVA